MFNTKTVCTYYFFCRFLVLHDNRIDSIKSNQVDESLSHKPLVFLLHLETLLFNYSRLHFLPCKACLLYNSHVSFKDVSFPIKGRMRVCSFSSASGQEHLETNYSHWHINWQQLVPCAPEFWLDPLTWRNFKVSGDNETIMREAGKEG